MAIPTKMTIKSGPHCRDKGTGADFRSAGLGVLLLLGLNGNAGRWHAECKGQRISRSSAPSASTEKSASERAEPETPPTKAAAKKAPAKKAAPKKAAPKKAVAKKTNKGGANG